MYLRLLMTHLGFNIGFINWVMSCITNVSFVVLINGVASPFFHRQRGLRQGCPLSPLLFLFVAKGLSQLIHFSIRRGEYKGIEIAINLFITHLISMDDILVFCDESKEDISKLQSIMYLFLKATRMSINAHKSSFTHNGFSQAEINRYLSTFLFEVKSLMESLKYLGFLLKPDSSKKIGLEMVSCKN